MNMFGRLLERYCHIEVGTISRWYRHIDGRPGIRNQALNTVKRHCSAYGIIGALMFDEMSIRKQVELYTVW
jgi:hypothetical protein